MSNRKHVHMLMCHLVLIAHFSFYFHFSFISSVSQCEG